MQFRPNTTAIAKTAYEAYSKATENKTFDGREMPGWDDLSQPVRNAWSLAAEAVRHQVLASANSV